MAKVTSSSDRSKRSTNKPVTKGQNPQRANRQAVSQAKVSSAEARKPSPRSAGINQGKGAGAGRVTGTQGRPKPATPAKVTTGAGGGSAAPSGRQPRAITNGNSPAMRQIRAKAVEAQRQTQGKSTVASRNTTVTPTNARGERIRSMAKAQRTIGDSGQVRAAAQRGKQAADAAKATRGARQAMARMGGTLARARLTRGPVSAAVGVAADATLSPLARKAGEALGKGPLTKLGRAIDRAMPGVNSKDEARLRNAAAAKAGSTSRFKGAREAAVKRAKAIKGSPVVGPRKSFDDTFRDARKAGKSTFTWKGKKYTTQMK
jgi:hypothetical protein